MERERRERLKAERKLFARPVTLNVDKANLDQVAAQIEAQLGVPVRLDLEAAETTRTWSLPANQRTLADVLDDIGNDGALMACFRDGVLWIDGTAPIAGARPAPVVPAAMAATREDLVAYLGLLQAAHRRWRETKITLTVDSTPLPDILKQFKEGCGFEIRMPEATAEVAGSIRVSIDFKETPATEVLSFLEEVTQFRVVVDKDGIPWFCEDRDEVAAAAPAWKDAARMDVARRRFYDDEEEIVERSSDLDALAAASLTKATLDVKDQPLPEALKELARASGIEVDLDYTDRDFAALKKETVSCAMKDAPVADILDAICRDLKCGWFADGALKVARAAHAEERRVRWIQAERDRRLRLAAQRRLFAREVTIKGDKPGAEAIGAQIEAQLGIPVRVDLAAAEPARTWTVSGPARTLADVLDDVTADNSLRVFYREGALWIVQHGWPD